MKEQQKKLAPYIQALPSILLYQIVTKLVIAAWVFLMGRLFRVLLNSMGRVAVSSGDFLFLFTHWQGLLIILLGLVSLYVYVALDLNASVILSKELLTGNKINVLDILKRALPTIKSFMCWRGFGVILYIALIAPILGIGVSLSMTQGLYIPTFISSVIVATPAYYILALIVMVIFLIIGLANIFIIHGVVLDKLSVGDASEQSRRLVRGNWKDFVKQDLLFILVISLLLVGVVMVFLVIPIALVQVIPMPFTLRRGLTIFFTVTGALLSLVSDLFAVPVYLMRMTELYYIYKKEPPIPFHPRESNYKLTLLGVAFWLLATVVITVRVTKRFDDWFPQNTTVGIVAHRGGGTSGAENTVAGIEKAWEIGAFGSEIDIQRTKDGYYVLNHDSNFARVAGESRAPEEMTLAEIKALNVDGEPIPTLEETLDASKGKGILFIELKGATCDKQMADDTVKAVKDRQMEDECVLISLQYDIIDYIETTYPEIQTGYLTFLSLGDTALLNCDYLALEEESATASAVDSIHKQGKKVLVWTANEKGSQRYFLLSAVDGLITDEIVQASDLTESLSERSDFRRMLDGVIFFIS